MSIKDTNINLDDRDLQYMDVKHMSEILESHRKMVRTELSAVRKARAALKSANADVSDFYARLEADMANSRLQSILKAWQMANRTYHAMVRKYLAKLHATTPRHADKAGDTRRAA